ncbi:MAG TPA: hypothetical protein VGO43_13320 [Pyrinomonadaceae bacterium]|jgi:uncharacterized membrane protein|nr:hypothetical protein [Pyrinomonadaceae bacterium]
MQEQPKSAFGLDQNVAAGLAYIPVCLCHLIVSIGILATDKGNKLPRFHAIQSLLISAAMIVGYVVTFVIVMIFVVIAGVLNVPGIAFIGFIFYFVLLAYILALLVGLIISCINGFQGKVFKLPVIGNLADKWSN